MEFNVSKCKMMYHGKDNAGYSYNMDKQPLVEVECEKGLEVIFYQDLKSSVHCKEAFEGQPYHARANEQDK